MGTIFSISFVSLTCATVQSLPAFSCSSGLIRVVEGSIMAALSSHLLAIQSIYTCQAKVIYIYIYINWENSTTIPVRKEILFFNPNQFFSLVSSLGYKVSLNQIPRDKKECTLFKDKYNIFACKLIIGDLFKLKLIMLFGKQSHLPLNGVFFSC